MVKYKTQETIPRTEEWQSFLLAKRARRALDAWTERDENGDRKYGEELDRAMRRLRHQVRETDVFYSGKHIGEEENNE